MQHYFTLLALVLAMTVLLGCEKKPSEIHPELAGWTEITSIPAAVDGESGASLPSVTWDRDEMRVYGNPQFEEIRVVTFSDSGDAILNKFENDATFRVKLASGLIFKRKSGTKPETKPEDKKPAQVEHKDTN